MTDRKTEELSAADMISPLVQRLLANAAVIESQITNRLEPASFSEALELSRYLERTPFAPAGGLTTPHILLAIITGRELGFTLLQSLILARYGEDGLTFDGLEELVAGAELAELEQADPPAAESEEDRQARREAQAEAAEEIFIREEQIDALEYDRRVSWSRFKEIGKERGRVLHSKNIAHTPRELVNALKAPTWRRNIALFDAFKGNRQAAIREVIEWCRHNDAEAVGRTVGEIIRHAERSGVVGGTKSDEEEASAMLEDCASMLFMKKRFRTKGEAVAALRHGVEWIEKHSPNYAAGWTPAFVAAAAAELVLRCKRHVGEQ